MSTGGIVPSAFGLALLNLTVQRASRSLCASLAGLAFQSCGIRPSLIAAFSPSVLRCLGAEISEGGGAKIAAYCLVDELSDENLALAFRPPLAFLGHRDLRVEFTIEDGAQVFRSRLAASRIARSALGEARL